MSEPLPEALQLLNQRFMAHGCLSGQELDTIWTDDLQHHDKGNLTSLKMALKASSHQLQSIGLEIRGVVMNDEMYYSIINKQNDEISKTGFHSVFTTSEINYIRLIIEKLSEDESCTRANLVNAKNTLKEKDSLKLDDATRIVNRLVKDHWLMTADDSSGDKQKKKSRQSMQAKLKLGPRVYMELSYMLTEQFEVDKGDMPQQIFF